MYKTEHHTRGGISWIDYPARASAEVGAEEVTRARGGRCAVWRGDDLLAVYWDGRLVWSADPVEYRTADGRRIAGGLYA